MKHKFFAYCPESGHEFHEKLEDALAGASNAIQNYLDEDVWREEVTGVCVGEITHRAKMCDQVFPDGEIDEDGFDESGWLWDPDWEYKCNYKMLSVEQDPVPDASMIVEALEGLLAITSGSLGVSGYHLNGDIAKWSEFEEVAGAEEALAIYRKQGGES